MILKSIEIRGFKSFADSTELIFKQGITSVVGPNGSGKSNIADAIRWCLGEQSVKSLRGGKMEDVIFSGTQYRKQLSLAQVSLIIDNSERELPIDYSTVIISRKLYRSGESEYLINNKPCKLKDINGLFFDTGIGKEGYSLIGQGKIDVILNGNSNDRRAIIEEAIGITKYKFKKEEAYNKINHANENIVRINDMLFTYEEYLEPLKIESEKARKFIDLSNELKDLEILILYNNLYDIHEEIQSIKRDISYHNLKLSELSSEKRIMENKRYSFEKEFENLKIIEKKDKKKYYKIKDIIHKNTNIVNLKNNDISILINSNKIYEKQIYENKSKIDNIILRENIINKTRDELENEFNSILCNLEENKKLSTDNSMTLHNLENKINTILLEKNKIVNINNNIQNKIEFIRMSFSNIDNDKKAYLDEKQLIEDRIKKIDKDIEHIEHILYDLHIRESEVKVLSENLLNSIEKENKKIEIVDSQLNDLNKDVIIRQANLDALRGLDSIYDGFNKSSKTLMNEINSGSLIRFKDRCFIIGNILDTEEKYTSAIETVIGGHISDIVIDDYVFVNDLINHLKENNLGRVTFHPLNSVSKYNIKFNNEVKLYKGFINFAINLVKYDSKFSNIISNILGNTIICDNIDNALNIAKSINFSNRIVTLDSQIINSGGSITGGSSYFKKFNILGRQRKISVEGDDINKKLLYISELKTKLSNYHDVKNNIQSEFDINNNLLKDITIDIFKKNEELKRYIDLRSRDLKELDKKNIVLNNLDDIYSSNDEEINKLNYELNLNNEKFSVLENDEKNIRIECENYKKIIEGRENEITNYKIRKAKIEENISNIYDESKRIALEKKDLICANVKINDNINLNNVNIVKIEDSIQIFNKRIDNLNQKFNEYNFDSYILDQNRIQQDIKKLNGDINELDLSIHKIEHDINVLNIKNTKKEVEFNINNDNLFDKYSINFDTNDAEKYIIDSNELSKYSIKMKKITSDISDLGNINIKSIEEYEALNDKVNFITRQKEDLEKSKMELEGFIKNITSEMRNMFNQSFKLINENFNFTFKELFKGGSAQLLLGDGDELESDIEIIVQPPGKKLQNINLLSGGEKGLSAISLLFAILKLKPVPFCVLDEIEAALDDNNVIKFSTFLKQYSSNVQFIVITHRKPTMEASDVIYGVTMEEKGVSKVVSINLANYNT